MCFGRLPIYLLFNFGRINKSHEFFWVSTSLAKDQVRHNVVSDLGPPICIGMKMTTKYILNIIFTNSNLLQYLLRISVLCEGLGMLMSL